MKGRQSHRSNIQRGCGGGGGGGTWRRNTNYKKAAGVIISADADSEESTDGW